MTFLCWCPVKPNNKNCLIIAKCSNYIRINHRCITGKALKLLLLILFLLSSKKKYFFFKFEKAELILGKLGIMLFLQQPL
jgi:hypothetical protein